MPLIRGKGTGTSDSIPMQVQNGAYILPADTTNEIMVSDGEFEIPPEAMSAIGVQFLDMLRHQTSDTVKKARKESDGKHFNVGGWFGGTRFANSLADFTDNVRTKAQTPVAQGAGAAVAKVVKKGGGNLTKGLSFADATANYYTDMQDVINNPDVSTLDKARFAITDTAALGLGYGTGWLTRGYGTSPAYRGARETFSKLSELAGGESRDDIVARARQGNEDRANQSRELEQRMIENQALIDSHPNNPDNPSADPEAVANAALEQAYADKDYDKVVELTAGSQQQPAGVPEAPVEERTPVWSGNKFEASRTGRDGEPVYDLASLQQARERGFDPNRSVNSYDPEVMQRGLEARGGVPALPTDRQQTNTASRGVIDNSPRQNYWDKKNEDSRRRSMQTDLMRTITSSKSTRSQRAAAAQVLAQMESSYGSLGTEALRGGASRDTTAMTADATRDSAAITGDANRDSAAINAQSRIDAEGVRGQYDLMKEDVRGQYGERNAAATAGVKNLTSAMDAEKIRLGQIYGEHLQKGNLKEAEDTLKQMQAISGNKTDNRTLVKGAFGEETMVDSNGFSYDVSGAYKNMRGVMSQNKKMTPEQAASFARQSVEGMRPDMAESLFFELMKLAGFGYE